MSLEDEVADVVMAELQRRAEDWEEEARQARRDLNEVVEQLADVERGVRDLGEVLRFTRSLPLEAEI